MEIVVSSLNTVLPVVIMVAVGYFLRHIGLLDEAFALRINKLCLSALIPCAIFKMAYTASFPASAFAAAVYSMVVQAALAAPIVWLTGRFFSSRTQVGAMSAAILNTNAVLIGIPLMTNLFGEDHLDAMTLAITMNVPAITVATVIMLTYCSGGGRVSPSALVRRIATNPLIIAALLGVAFNLLSIPLPTVIYKTVGDLGSSATPIAMLAMGARLNFADLGEDRRAIAYGTVMRLIVVPGVIIVVAMLLGIRSYDLFAVFFATATPTAIVSVPMSDSYGCDGKLAGEILLVTSVLSCISLFIGICVLQVVGF